MLNVSHLEVGTLSSFLRQELGRDNDWPISLDKYRNGMLGQRFIESARSWQAGEKVIDVGCGYSDLPQILVDEGCEVWGADDFGLKSGDTFWLRGKHPDEFIKTYPEVRYVFERLGDDDSSIPQDYFDVAISNQALHVASPPHAPIWQDMLRVLKKEPGSEILVSMICNFGSDGNPDNAIDRLESISQMENEIITRLQQGELVTVEELDELQENAGNSFHRFSPALYAVYVAVSLEARPFVVPAELLAENFCTRVNALIEPANVGFNNARFSNNPDEARKYRYGRYAPILMKLTWVSDDNPNIGLQAADCDFTGWEEYNARLCSPEQLSDYSVQPLGTARHTFLCEDDADAAHFLYSEFDLPANKHLEFKVQAKPAGRGFLALWLRGPRDCDDMIEVFFDLTKGKTCESSEYGKAKISSISIASLGDGWVECSIAGVPSPSEGYARGNIVVRKDATGSSQYQGDDKIGVYISQPRIRCD